VRQLREIARIRLQHALAGLKDLARHRVAWW
jgi:hypothetical protein